MLKLLVLDFDGLLVESEAIKDAGFAAVFADHPERAAAIRAYNVANRHLIRYAKFKHITEVILGLPYAEADERRIAAAYAAYTRERIIACPYVPGAPEFLAFFDGRVPMYLASATPADELRLIVEGRGLARHFRGILGAPRKKADILRELMQAEGVPAAATYYVGDSLSDLKAAREAGVGFVGRNREDDFAPLGVPHFDDLFGIRAYLAPLVAG